ncbi:hypothetical protein H8K90_04250 [Winogradskyella echinorum]|uniref:Uncharacterized protein n=1 Tax=Winogradskyella echinorum TaxID=538189 RepID=A0ABR6Y004_9FLAO|nr:hypothetical protein [Winogradskyella echinorum]MBC3845585.1 hypothetical protein [Winogradskyella echinorum]MBC5749933.1 hypothetical protein [Winogradskyella echinorum]
MKTKLKKFTEFSKTILPNEAKYLENRYQFTDSEKRNIISLVIANALSQNKPVVFDSTIDKRKYSYIKDWIEKKLASIDVDATIAWIMSLNKKILTDAIASNEEKDFLNYISSYKNIEFNFQNLYELAKEYKSYLLVRMRYKDHDVVADFIETYKTKYAEAKEIKDKLYKATTEITNQYTRNNNETKHLETWLLDVFNDKNIDGKNRYQAFVLLAFMYTNYNENDKLKVIFNQIDYYFSEGEMYSRRLLSNYYASRVLLHSKQDEFEEAEFYGYLSIRQKNNDALMYLNNLVAILLRNNKPEGAFTLLEQHHDLYKETHNYHQKIGYCSYRVRVLSELQKHKLAESTAKTFLKKYKNEVLNHRWHHFFTSYINVLIILEKYEEVLKLASKFNLIEKESERQKQNNYVPNIFWSISLSRYMEGQINSNRLLEEIKAPLKAIHPTKNQKQLMIKVIDRLSNNLPEAFLELKSHI